MEVEEESESDEQSENDNQQNTGIYKRTSVVMELVMVTAEEHKAVHSVLAQVYKFSYQTMQVLLYQTNIYAAQYKRTTFTPKFSCKLMERD